MARGFRLLGFVVAVALGSGLGLASSASAVATPSFDVVSIDGTGCASSAMAFTMVSENFDGVNPYTIHTKVSAGGLVYMNEGLELTVNETRAWTLYSSFSYAAVPNPGTFPLPEDTPVYVDFVVEQPKGTVLNTRRLVFESCNSGTVEHSGRDRCPTVDADTLNGCPLLDRTLALGYSRSDHALVGALVAPGHRVFAQERPVTIFRKRPGPDLKVARTTTSRQGTFLVHYRGRGRLYATSPGLVEPEVGQVLKDTSATIRVG